jgi:phosphatidylserine decarboxylase
MINSACLTPPSYSNHELVGFPINSIFVEFMQNENGRAFFGDPRVNEHLKDILNDYQQMLLSPASLEFMDEEEPNGWFCSGAREKIEYHQYACAPELPHYGFKNWNEWFLRQFKAGFRPVGEGSPAGAHPDNIIVNSCESVPLVLPLQPQPNVKKTDNFWLKDDVYSLSDMFAAARFKKHHYADLFEGGTVYQAFLSALFYHRWHAPVDGVIEDIYEIPGTYYLDQSQFIPYDEASPDKSESFLSAVAARKVVVIDASNKHIGKVAIIYIGMAEVSSCITTVQVGDVVAKGQEIGHFEFGGSSHTIIFEKKANLIFNDGLYSQVNGQTEGNKQNLSSFLAEVVVPE